MSDGKAASRRALLGLSGEERRAWIAAWREHSQPADLRGFAEAQKTLFGAAAELSAAGLTPASPQAQRLAERWMKLLRRHSMIAGVIRIHRANPALALKVAANARKSCNRTARELKDVIPPEELFLREARRIRMENSGLDELQAEVSRLIETNVSPASRAAKRAADRFLEYCKAQFFDDPESFAQLLSHYAAVERIDGDGHRAVWEFVARTLRVLRDSQQ